MPAKEIFTEHHKEQVDHVSNQASHLIKRGDFKVSEKVNLTATATEQISLARRSRYYWRVTFDRPPLNIFGPETIPQLNEIITALETDEDVKVVVFDSAVAGFSERNIWFTVTFRSVKFLATHATMLQAAGGSIKDAQANSATRNSQPRSKSTPSRCPTISGWQSRTGLATDAETIEMSYSGGMDYLQVLREKIGRLRGEIAEIQELNERYRRQDRNDRDAQIAHGQRHERLQAIQQELSQLSSLGRKVQSVEEIKEKHRFRLQLVKKAS